MTAVTKEEPTASKKPSMITRSPGYPFIPIEKALAKAKDFYQAERKNAVPVSSAYTAWGYGSKSSGGRQTAATMRYYGLVDYNDKGDIFLTKLALDILLDVDPDSTERMRHIREAALSPKIHRELWDRYGNQLPSEGTILTFLMKEKQYNDTAAKDVFTVYKETLGYAAFSQSDTIPENSSDKKTEAEAGKLDTNNSDQNYVVKPALMVQQPVSVAAGERAFLSGPLSKDVSYRLLVSGKVGPKELTKLVKMLNLQIEILGDTDEESDEDPDTAQL